MPTSVELATLARYFDGVATPEEQAAVDAWIGADPERQALVEQLRTAWVADAERLGAPSDAEAVWGRLTQQLGLGDRPARVLQLVPPRRSVWSGARAAGWAAALVGAVVVGGASWHLLRERPAEPIAAAAAMREYVTPRGQRASFRLADGTEVMLNAESRLRVPIAFGTAGRPRAVELVGQGYFTVVHDDTRPFTVHTAHGVTRDIGTRFDVRAYVGDSVERVVVAEGEVAVRPAESPADAEVSLREGQMAVVAPAGEISIPRRVDLDRELGWTRGRLELDDVTLAEAARRVGRWYDLDVRVADPALADRRVNGSYGDEPIAHVLTVLTAAVGARYEWRDRTVTILPAAGAR